MRRFAVVGVLATAIDIGVAVALLRRGWSLPTADLVALATAAVFAHPLHRAITLRDDPFTRWMRSPGAFAAVVTTAGLVDMLVLSWVRIDGTLTDDILSKATAVAAAAIVRAVAYRTLLFRVVRREQEHPVRRPLPEGTHRLTVVLPAYREADRIGDTVTRVRTELGERLGDTLEALQIVVVDDGSDDDTSGAAAAAGADTVVRLEVNSGKGAAVRAGVAAATGSTIAFTDADLAYSPAQIADLMTLVEDGYDMVVGSRRHTDTRTLVAAGRIREAGGRLVNLATHALLLGQYHDTQCGLKAFRADAARALFDASRLDGFAFDVELFHLAERWRLPLAEVPVEVEYSDRSTVSVLSDGLRLVADLIRVRQASRRGDYPNPTQLGAHTDG
ncbi:MAG: glycosyltransferase [Acidimicrobiales bacterium]|jgi:putative flippase GtrA|nr:glycosyltransferase [Acidimicrobiales bacterium]